MIRGALTAALVACVAVRASLAQLPPVLVAPADDAALASMLLIAAGTTQPVLLFDPQDPAALRRFTGGATRAVECFTRTATPSSTRALLEAQAGGPCTHVDDLPGLARRLWSSPRVAVLAPTTDYASLLRGAALAGAARGALIPVGADSTAAAAVLDAWPLDLLYVLPGTTAPTHRAAHVVRLKSADAITRVSLRRLGEEPRTIVVANPTDRDGLFSPSSLSLLAPLVAGSHRGLLVLSADPAPDAVEGEVRRVIAALELAPTHLYLVGDELALRSRRVPDPVMQAGGPAPIGGARDVRVELFSEIDRNRPQDYAVGRLVAEDAAQGSATLARQLHGGLATGGRAVVLSNADQEFELGETIARTTASELRNAGLQVHAAYRDAVTPAVIRDALQNAGLLVWEGHARDLTLDERGSVGVERTPPLVVLQGCYTFDRSDPFVLFERGTQAIVATSAAIYSASGASFARALLDSLLYGDADLGTAVRNARNYLLAVAELKQRRGHTDWPKTYRAALAFALWGDPTARPALATQAPKIAPVRWFTSPTTLELEIPPRRLKAATVGRYAAQPVPRAMLSGLILRAGDATAREIKELFFDALPAPSAITAACPPAPGWDVVSLYAPHTRTLSVLARPPGDAPDAAAAPGVVRFPLVADATRCPGAPPAPSAGTPPARSVSGK